MAPFRDEHIRCPSCTDVALSVPPPNRVPQRACPSCRGTWIRHRDLEVLYREVDLVACPGEPAGPSARRCPECRTAMQVKIVPGETGSVELDVCPTHGLWFDGEELLSVLEAAAAAADRRRPWRERVNPPFIVRLIDFLTNALDAGEGKNYVR